ncbi:ribbon-helix-helix protein, CopG family [Novispirillum itersonii]|uniref:Uncharacterized protein n=1 Tax=Novispirillum itersonii TaxID=189 RepID=A0A7X0DNW3_NOVIT|nr:ribbon-helix-helix protein, CopG family [Novispirillum itersonii]MBB6212415.1 hypothetical protein [Novispirillum itersonii]
MPSRKPFAKVLLDPKDEARLNELCAQSRLSRSQVFKRLLHNLPLPSKGTFEGWDAITDLMKINADQARLGNLLKLALAEVDVPADLLTQIRALSGEIAETQALLKDTAVTLRGQLQPRRKSGGLGGDDNT